MQQKAWIMLVKAGQAKYLQLSVYDQNLNPQEGRMIFDGDEPPVQEVPIVATEVFPNQPVTHKKRSTTELLRYLW